MIFDRTPHKPWGEKLHARWSTMALPGQCGECDVTKESMSAAVRLVITKTKLINSGLPQTMTWQRGQIGYLCPEL